MSRLLQDERSLLSPPGDDILEHIRYIKMSQAELADRLDKTSSKVNDLIKGKEPITYATALQLEKVLGVEAKFWLNREMQYREKLTRLEQQEMLEDASGWAKQHPISELRKSGYLKSGNADNDLVADLLEFYGVANIPKWKARYIEEYSKADYRKNVTHQSSLAAMAAFLRIGEIEMQKLDLPEFDKSKFRKVLLDVNSIVRDQPTDFARKLKDLCASAGVAIVYTMCLPKAPVNGAARWFRSTPLIQLTDRYKTNDRFWFTFFHEAGHIMLHGRKEIFLEEYGGYKETKRKEIEANEFAMKYLLPIDATDNLPGSFTDGDIKALAKAYNTHPGIVIGRLQWEDVIGYNECNHLKAGLKLF